MTDIIRRSDHADFLLKEDLDGKFNLYHEAAEECSVAFSLLSGR